MSRSFMKLSDWILELGPIVDGFYDYSIVSDPFKASLFVLTRDVSRFYAKYDAGVQQTLKKLGFSSFINKPVKTLQDGCVYDSDISN